MPSPKSVKNLKPPVRTSEEAKALAALGAGRPPSERPLKAWAGKLYADQLDALDRLGVNRSELIRELLDEYLAQCGS